MRMHDVPHTAGPRRFEISPSSCRAPRLLQPRVLACKGHRSRGRARSQVNVEALFAGDVGEPEDMLCFVLFVAMSLLPASVLAERSRLRLRDGRSDDEATRVPPRLVEIAGAGARRRAPVPHRRPLPHAVGPRVERGLLRVLQLRGATDVLCTAISLGFERTISTCSARAILRAW